MAKITANNILASSITSDKLDSSVASGLATATNANTLATIATAVAAAAFATANTNAAILANSASPLITTIQIADSSYNILDDTAANTTGGYVVITGSGFTNSSTVVFGSTAAPAVSFVNSTTLRAQVPALTAASYPVYVVNSNGGTGIRINGLTTSSFPAWSTGATLSNQNANTSFSVNLSANSDSSITYANTTSLPAGTTLAANGLFSGIVTIGTQTTYTFDVKATDVENQDASRTFSLTVTIGPAPGLYVWGFHSGNGEDGLNIGSSSKSSPTQVGTDTNWNQISTARYSVLATKTDGTLWSWGNNSNGQLGHNDRVNRSSPVQIGTNTNWSLISISPYFFAAIKTDGTLWTWGQNDSGQHGRNDRVNRSSPVQVSGTTWSKIGVGRVGVVSATKTDGTLWMWGINEEGQLGRNDRVTRSSPIQVGSDTTWSQAKLGDNYTIATKTNGTLWSWGYNNNGQLGRNDTVRRSSPVQIGANTNWSLNNFVIGAPGPIQAATKTDGTLWTWGKNDFGQLGHNNRGVYRSSPTQVGTETNWSLISGGAYSFTATKTDGTLWSWGQNNYGQLGRNDKVTRSSPIQVGSATNWTLVSMGPYAGFAKLS